MRYNAFMSKNAVFLDLFNHLDESIRSRYDLEDRTASSISFLVNKLNHSTSKELLDLAEELDSIRQLRNTLVHTEKVKGQDLAEVNPLLLDSLQKAILFVENPPKALSYAIPYNHLYVVGMNERLDVVLEAMSRRGFSHVPVLEGNQLAGVFSQEVLTDYLLGHGSLALNSGLEMKDFLPDLLLDQHHNERYVFFKRDALLEDARDAFSSSKQTTGKRLSMIFITEHGLPNETLLGALVPSSL